MDELRAQPVSGDVSQDGEWSFPERLIEDCLLRDRGRFRKRVRRLAAARAEPDIDIERIKQRQAHLLADVLRSCEAANARANVPCVLNYPPALPFSEHVEALRNIIADHQVVLVSGATGSGKSTQLPKVCLELGRGWV